MDCLLSPDGNSGLEEGGRGEGRAWGMRMDEIGLLLVIRCRGDFVWRLIWVLFVFRYFCGGVDGVLEYF